MPLNATWFICSCDKRLETTDDVDAHDKSWLALGHDKRCRYPGCTTISPQTSNAKRHWRTHLPERLGKYFCSKCDASYVKPEALKKHEAAVVCRKNRKRCRSIFEEDPALAVPSITPRNDMSSPDGHAVESEPSPEAPSNDTSQQSTTTAPSPTMVTPLSTESQPDHAPPVPAQDAWKSPPNGTLIMSPLQQQQYMTMTALLDQQNILQDHMPAGFRRPESLPAGFFSSEIASSLGSSRERTMDSMSASLGFGLNVTPRLLSPLRESSMSDNPGPASQEGNGFHHVQHLDDTRMHACSFYGCTQHFESQTSLQRHKRSCRYKAHNDRDSDAESGVVSVSLRPYARAELRRYLPPVRESDYRYSEIWFTIDRSQEFDLLDLRTKRTGREPLRWSVILNGLWDSDQSLLDDFTKELHFKISDDRQQEMSSYHLWSAITKTMTTRPPGILKGMFDFHARFKCESRWLMKLEWTEEGIDGHWKLDAMNFGPANELSGITVSELS